jgi:serine/threonine protein kinase
MESNPSMPDPAERPSSVARPVAPDSAGSAVAKSLPAPDSGDESPTIISLNRSRTPSEPAENLQGKKLGHFELIEPIGVGGMAAVIRAHDLQLGRVVALKILPPEMAVDPENISRFKQEARAAAKLDHENIARVYFCGEDQGLHFIAFEYVEGDNLRSLMARGGPLRPDQAVRYMLQIAAGLAHASSRGVVHRDIKPSNIIITPEGRAKIVDMGLARSTDVHGGVTQSGVTLGTFDYISPEQAIEPRAADIRSDIYSLGCTFYHLLTGQPPVPDGTAAKKLHHHQNIAPLDPRELNPAIPDELAAVLGKMMAKEPRDRYQRPEHLIQHLLGVAQKMNLPAEAVGHESMLFVDASLPQPPRFSPVLAAVAAVAAVAIMAVILGVGGRQEDPRPLPNLAPWQGKLSVGATNGSVANSNPNDTPERIAVEKEPRTAATVDELARLLLDPSVDSILLTGDDYNLAELARTDPASDSPQFLTANHSVKLFGKVNAEGARPVIRCNVEANAGRDPDRSLALLTATPGPTATHLELRRLKFVVQASRSDSPVFAVSTRGLNRLTVSECEFSHDGKPDYTGGGAIQFEGTGLSPSVLDLDRCCFARGACAIDASNRGLVRARQCAFGPYDTLFMFREKAVPATASPERLLAELNHCTALLHDGTVFLADSNVSGTIRAGNCVFARDAGSGSVVLVRQQDPDQKVIFDALADGSRSRNVYQGIAYWASPTILSDRPPQFKDRDAIELPRDRSPWKNSQPLRLLETNPREVFVLQTNRAELRMRGRPDAMIGVQQCAFGGLYPDSLPPVQEQTAEIANNVRIVDPDRPIDERQHSYPTLAAALDNAPSGELTVLIRHTGTIQVYPQIISKNVQLTVKPEGSHRPILIPSEKTDMQKPSMFTVNNGSVTFIGLQFRLKPAPDDDNKWASVVTLTGAGQCGFENCVATLDAGEDAQPALATIDSAASAGAGDKPKIHMNNCFLRGKGNAVAVRGSRPFQLEADNVLAVLTNSFVLVIGQSKEMPLSWQSQIVCRHVTTYLGDAFLDLRSSENGMKVTGLVPTQVRCNDCLLVASNDRPLVNAVGVDRDTLVKTLLTWEGEGRDLYGNFQKYLDVKTSGTMMQMGNEWTARDWLQFTRESDNSFAHVAFSRSPTDDGGYIKAIPSEFRAKLFDMKQSDVSATNFGADLALLPKIDDE